MSFHGNVRRTAMALLLALPGAARASFLSGEALDTAANVLSWIVLVVVPIGAIVLFWLVHVLPEKIAHKRHHPQQDAIKTLCMLSLFFGGLLWPFAWLWAYTKPVMHRMAYGTDKHEGYFHDLLVRARAGEADPVEISGARRELSMIEAKGALDARVKNVLTELEQLERDALEREAMSVAATTNAAKGA
jgi:hypothetical protein